MALRLPAPLLRTWMDLQLNFDFIGKQLDPYSEVVSFAGAWLTAVPGPTTGAAFTLPRAGRVIIHNAATAYTNAGGNCQVRVYVDGVDSGRSMLLNATTPTLLRMALGPCILCMTLKAGTHYVAWQQISGTSDVGDYGNISVTLV